MKQKIVWYPTVICMLLAFVYIGCDVVWPNSKVTPMKVQSEVVDLVTVPDVEDVICPCPSEDIVMAIQTPAGVLFYLIQKGDFDDPDSNPNIKTRKEFDAMNQERERMQRESEEAERDALKESGILEVNSVPKAIN